MDAKKQLSQEKAEYLIGILKLRFQDNMKRHEGLEWYGVVKRLNKNSDILWSINEMERTGGEPDVVGIDEYTGEYIFFDCSLQSPLGRRSLCYDREALESRKKFKPESSAEEMAANMGVQLLTEEQYRMLQNLGEFDTKTSSWVKTPGKIRELGGALFCDRRFNRVFVYHNGADSYYAVRGFRSAVSI